MAGMRCDSRVVIDRQVALDTIFLLRPKPARRLSTMSTVSARGYGEGSSTLDDSDTESISSTISSKGSDSAKRLRSILKKNQPFSIRGRKRAKSLPAISQPPADPSTDSTNDPATDLATDSSTVPVPSEPISNTDKSEQSTGVNETNKENESNN